jgi:hypothetical protein
MQQTLNLKFSIQVVNLDHLLLAAQLISLEQALVAEQQEAKQAIETGLELGYEQITVALV